MLRTQLINSALKRMGCALLAQTAVILGCAFAFNAVAAGAASASGGASAQLSAAAALPTSLRGMPTTGNVKPIVLLLEFADYQHQISSSVIAQKISGSTGGAYGSLRNYYYNSSYGKFDLSNALVLGWYEVGSYRSDIIRTKAGREEIVGQILTNLTGQIDFTQYDSDGDGNIDQLIVIWSGPNDGGEFWWSYADVCVDATLTYDGKRVKNYAWMWETYDTETPNFDLMTAIRLTGDMLGLPSYADSAPATGPKGGIGGYDIMDSAVPNVPRVDHNAFSKLLLGWIAPTAYNSGVTTVTMTPAETSSSAVQLMKAGSAQTVFGEYFLVENRRNGTGNDLDLPGSGLMVWHVNSALDISGSAFNYNNTDTATKLLKLMQADGLGSIETGSAMDAGDFYATGSHFGPGTTPDSNLYSGAASSIDIDSVTATATATFVLSYNTPPGAVTDLAASAVTGVPFLVQLSWTQPANAASYEIRYSTIAAPGTTSVPWASASVWTSTKTADSATETEYVSGLTGATTYYFKIKTFNPTGGFTFSNAVSRRPWNAPPGAPYSVYATPIDHLGHDGLSYINWTADGADDAYGNISIGAYALGVSTYAKAMDEWSVGDAVTTGALRNIQPGGLYAFRYEGLMPDTTYYLALWVRDAEGNWSTSPGVDYGYMPPDNYPEPPVLTAESLNRAIKFTWTEESRDIDYYEVYLSTYTPYFTQDSSGNVVSQFLMCATTATTCTIIMPQYSGGGFRVKAYDKGPFVKFSTSTAIEAYSSDKEPPLVQNLVSPTHPNENTIYVNNTPTFQWEASDTGGSELAGIYVALLSTVTPIAFSTEVVASSYETLYSSATEFTFETAQKDGDYYFYVVAMDSQGNLSDLVKRKVRIDWYPEMPSTPTLTAASGQITVTWNAPVLETADLDYYELYCDTVTKGDWSDSFLLAATTDTQYIHTDLDVFTTYYYRVRSVDTGPLVLRSSPTAAAWARPLGVTEIGGIFSTTHPSTYTWYSGNLPSFWWTTIDVEQVGIREFHIAFATYALTQAEVLDQGSVQSAYVYTSTETLADGEWYFQIVAVDSASVNSAVARYHFLVDASTPVAPAGLYSAPGQNSILLSWDTPYMAYDIASYSLYCDSTTPYDFANQYFVGTTTTTSYLHTGLTNYQPYAYRLTATDRNGHTSDYSGVLNDYSVDGSSPVITSLASSNLPIEDTWYPDPNPIYTWSATDAGGSGLRGYYYILASTPVMTAEEVVSTGTYTAETTVSYSGLADGVWYFYLVAEDNQGNLSMVSRHETRIDYAPGAPRNLNLVPRYRKITLLWDAPSPEPNDFSYYRVYCDSTAPYDFADGFILARSTEPTYAHLNLDAANTYYYRVTTVDGAPNVLESTFSASAGARPVSSIAINSIVSVTHPSTSAWYTGRLPSFAWSVEGNGGIGVESYYVAITTYAMSVESVVASGFNITTNTYTAAASLPDGEWTFSIVSRDLLGDYSALASYPFKIDASSPPAPTNLVAVSSQNSIALSWNTPIYTYDVDHYLLYCDSVSPYDFGDAFLATSTAGNFYLHQGLTNYLPYHYRVYAVDKQGNVGNYADTANNAPIDITAPVMGGIVSASHPDQYVWYEDSSVTLNWSAADAGGSGINGYYYLLSDTETITSDNIISTGVYTSSAGVVLLNVPDGLSVFQRNGHGQSGQYVGHSVLHCAGRPFPQPAYKS